MGKDWMIWCYGTIKLKVQRNTGGNRMALMEGANIAFIFGGIGVMLG